ncbi:MAG: NTP transferase domain-containing protein [Pirellulales bacterium]
MSRNLAVVLAAGKGTRMKSDLPKVLIEVSGRPMLEYVLESLRAGGVEHTMVVVGYRAELVRQTLADWPGITFVEQTEQLGTGHAVMVCRDALEQHEGAVLIVAGDSPMMRSDTVASLLAEFERCRPACLLGTAHKVDPAGLGRIVRDEKGEFLAIVEEKDATEKQRRITEVNMSCYIFDCRELLHALGRIRADNVQKEYYLTDAPGILKSEGKDVRALAALKPSETLSINTFEELAAVEAAMEEQE